MKIVLVLSVLALALLGAGSAVGGVADSVQTGSIVRTWSAGDCSFQCWVCNGPVQLDSVTILVDTKAVRVDAVRLAPGCTGTIGRLDIVTYSSDAVKVADGVHDLVVGGGTINCRDKIDDPWIHQDGIQVLGGRSITFQRMNIDCGREQDTKVNSNMFINGAAAAASPPTDVICEACWLGPGAAHTITIANSLRSGVVRSTLCPSKFAGLTLNITTDAVRPVDRRNVLPLSCSHL